MSIGNIMDTFSNTKMSMPLKQSTKDHLKAVYFLLTLTLLSCFATHHLALQHRWHPNFLTQIGTIACMVGVKMMTNTRENYNTRVALMLLSGALSGVSVTPLIVTSRAIDPSIPYTALAGTVGIFLSFSLAAIFSKNNRSFLIYGGMLGSALSVLSIMGLINYFFFQSTTMAMMYIYGGLLVFSSYIGYDTQKMILEHENGKNDTVNHAIELFVDFVQVFVRLLAILAKNANNKNSRSNNNNANNNRGRNLSSSGYTIRR